MCDKAFRQQGILMNHIRVHTGGKPYIPYKCHMCNMAFTCSGILQCHMSVHTGEKP